MTVDAYSFKESKVVESNTNSALLLDLFSLSQSLKVDDERTYSLLYFIFHFCENCRKYSPRVVVTSVYINRDSLDGIPFSA